MNKAGRKKLRRTKMDVDVWNRIRFGDRTVIDHRHDLLAVLPEDGAADFGFMKAFGRIYLKSNGPTGPYSFHHPLYFLQPLPANVEDV